MLKNPLVSVIMPSYCQGQYIKEAIDSVLNQTYSNLELIIVDNYSTDMTIDVIHEFNDPRIRLFQFNNEGIIAKSRNYAVSFAKGSIIAFLDTDDIWAQDKLAIQIPLLDLENIAAVSSGFTPIGETKYAYNYVKSRNNRSYERFNLDDLLQINRVITSSLIMKKADFEQLGGFDEDSQFAFYEDWELWLRMTHDIGDIVCYLERPLVQYRIVKKKTRDQRKVSLSALLIAKKMKKIAYFDEKQYVLMCNSHYFSIGMAHLEVADPTARKYFLRTVFQSPMLQQRVKSLVGLFLSFFPKRILSLLLVKFYHCRKILLVYFASH